MTTLPRTMYPKKTFGRSLFIGEFKHAVTATTSALETASATQTKHEEPSVENNEVEETEETSGKKHEEEVNVSRTLTYEVHDEDVKPKTDETKLVWKNSSGQVSSVSKTSKGLSSKAFFTPASTEVQGNDGDHQVVDRRVVKDEASLDPDTSNKTTKKKKPITKATNSILTTRKNLRYKSLNFKNPNKPDHILKSQKATERAGVDNNKSENSSTEQPPPEDEEKEEEDDEEEEEEEEGEEEEEEQEVEGEQEEEEREETDQPYGESNKEGIVNEQQEDSKEVVDNENDGDVDTASDHTPEQSSAQIEGEAKGYGQSKLQPSQRSKSIVIKPPDLAGYAEKLKEENEPEPTNFLEPDVVADIKRDLAEKGIITLPPHLEPAPHLPNSVLEETEDKAASSPDDERTRNFDTLDDNLELDAITEQSSELNAEKSDKREVFKTNKSFEIRRLQAKAEREKEEKKKARIGSRYSKLKARSDHMSRSNDPSTRVGSLKGVLKPRSSSGGVEIPHGILSPSPNKLKTTVRIRDPEYDYQEYTDVEVETDSCDSIRPNSSLSMSEFDAFSDASGDSSSSFVTNVGDLSFRDGPCSDEENSLQENDIHVLYDEIDHLSPSRVGFYGNSPKKESRSFDSRRERVESSARSIATPRSSLHLNTENFHPQQPSYFHSYSDKPLHLFDAMRHGLQSSDSYGSRSSRKLGNATGWQARKEPTFVIENERPDLLHPRSRDISRSYKNQKQQHKGSRVASSGKQDHGQVIDPKSFHSHLPAAFGPAVYPTLDTGEIRYTQKEWKKRIDKFFETSYVNHDTKVKKRKGILKNHTARESDEQDRKSFAMKLRCCKFLDCSEMSLTGHLLCVIIPTVVCTIALLLAILYAAGVLPA